jgi:hypothetical protein
VGVDVSQQDANVSYDYLLYRPKRSLGAMAMQLFAGRMGKLMALTDSLEGPAIGTVEEVKALIAQALPKVQWQKVTPVAGFTPPLSGVSDWSWRTVGVPEIGLGANASEEVRLLSMARAEPAEVKRIARALNLRVIDEQAFD